MRPLHRMGFVLVALTLVVFLLASYSAPYSYGEVGPGWLTSYQESQNLVVSPNLSLHQWKETMMKTLVQSDGTVVKLMAIHNSTYLVILIERSLNSSLNSAGVVLHFSLQNASTMWEWISGQQILVNDHHVTSAYSLSDGKLTVVFGAPISANGSDVGFRVGVPFPSFLKVITWDNGTVPSSVNFSNVPALGLELLPFPSPHPIRLDVYAIVILTAGLAFIYLEIIKYRKGDKD